MNKYKFKYPLHITGTFDQLIEIRVELYKLGYLDEENAYILDTDDQFICTQFYPHARNDFRGGLDYFQTGLLKTDTVVSANNRDLVLALAAMHDDDHFHEGEILRFIGHSGKSTDLYRLHLPKDGRRYPTLDFLFDDYRTNYQYDFAVAEMETLKEWRKATKEEIIETFQSFYSATNSKTRTYEDLYR